MRFHHECWLTLQTTSETLVDAVLVFWVIVYSLPETVVAQTYSQTQTPLLSIRLTNILLNKFIFAWMTNLSIIPKKTWVDGLLNDWMREWMHECVGEWARGNKWFYISVVLQAAAPLRPLQSSQHEWLRQRGVGLSHADHHHHGNSSNPAPPSAAPHHWSPPLAEEQPTGQANHTSGWGHGAPSQRYYSVIQ